MRPGELPVLPGRFFPVQAPLRDIIQNVVDRLDALHKTVVDAAVPVREGAETPPAPDASRLQPL